MILIMWKHIDILRCFKLINKCSDLNNEVNKSKKKEREKLKEEKRPAWKDKVIEFDVRCQHTAD